MKNRMKLAAVAVSFTLLLASSSQAVLVLVNDFESGLTGINSNGSVSIVTDPDVGTNNALEIFGIADAHVPGFTIADNSISTLFVRARLTDAGTSAFGSKGSFGPTDNDWATADAQSNNIFNVRARVGSVNGNDAGGRTTFTGAYDGNTQPGGTANIQGSAPDAWQNFWFVLNTTDDTFDLYVEGGTFGTQTQVADDYSWYRDDLKDSSGTMVAFYIEAISGGTETYIDDIYVDTAGVDLSNPTIASVPEPSSFLFGLTVLGLVLRQQHRKAS